MNGELGDVSKSIAHVAKLLQRRDRFEAELRREIPDEIADEVMAKIRPFLDDGRVIKAYLRSHSGRHSIGRERLRTELTGRGAPDGLIEAALAELPDETERAIQLLGDSPRPSLPKAGRFLISRGFDEESVEAALAVVFPNP